VPAFDIDELGALALFVDLPRDQLAFVARAGTELRVPAGQAVVERWESGRDFYVIVEGDADRTATVVATSDLRLLALSPSRLAPLVRAFPPLGGTLRKVASERMQTM
jgi:CRP-like cAMP-binding protein